MNSINSLGTRIAVVIQKNPLRFFASIFLVYATLWTLLEPILSLVGLTQVYVGGWIKYLAFVLISLILGTYWSVHPKDVVIKYNGSIIRITFGDLFSFNGFKAIPVSRFFYEIEVIETSLQNLVIRRFMQSKEGEKGLNNYKSQLDHELQGKQFSEINGRKFFALGTTVPVSLLDQEYLLFSITKTELKGAIPADNCNISNMWKALQLFWAEARIHSRGKDINIPLIGSGITGIDLPPAYILELNIIAVLDSLKEGGKITTGEIRVVLHPKYIEDIRLDILEQAWR